MSLNPAQICHPDEGKSCACCCGLYHIPDARKPVLAALLERRTSLFALTPRTADAIAAYKAAIHDVECISPLDPVIHFCEFIGFLDSHRKRVGCMLHPTAVGSAGVDYRGLCHYGGMACKAFHCPACYEIPPRFMEILTGLIDDWHIWGLVATDVDFTVALFTLLERRLGRELTIEALEVCGAVALTQAMLNWKEDWSPAGVSSLRTSRYYHKPTVTPETPDRELEAALIRSLRDTFGTNADSANEGLRLLHEKLDEFSRLCGKSG